LKQKFFLYPDDSTKEGRAICNFLRLCKTDRTDIVSAMIQHYLKDGGIEFYAECDNKAASDVYIQALKLHLLNNETMNDKSKKNLLDAISGLGGLNQKASLNMPVDIRDNGPLEDNTFNEEKDLFAGDEEVSESERENAQNTMLFFSDGQ